MALDPQRERTGSTRLGGGRLGGGRLGGRRLTTETKHASKTTELYAYIAAVIGVLIASVLIGADDDAGRGDNFGDYFTAHDAWRLIAFLTIGYMIARGLAKSGSREPYWEDGTNEERERGGGDS